MRKESERVRFWRYVELSLGCWIWRGTKSWNGYGAILPSGAKVKVYAHRLAYEMFIGKVPDGYELHHLCGIKACVKPDHLELVTRKQHAQHTHDRAYGGWQRIKTHCSKGHPFTGDNLKIRHDKDGTHRRCRECINQAQREYQARRRIVE